MTLIMTVNGPESIWLLADRRLSYERPRPPKDDARKVMFLETTDGVAILGYAGLAATALGTEPSDWMSAVLRGRNLPLEQSLGALAEAMKKQFPPHMAQMPGGGGGPVHDVVVSAFLGKEPRLYTIDLAFAPDRKSYKFRYTRHVVDKTSRPPSVAIGGSGGLYLYQDKKKWKKWRHSLLCVVRANDRGRVSPHAVADHLANLNNEVYLSISDKSVGPRCVVAWRHRKGGVHNGGGGQQFYSGTTRDNQGVSLPTIVNGMDLQAILSVIGPPTIKMLVEMRAGQPAKELNKDEINAELARLPDKPDEKLR